MGKIVDFDRTHTDVILSGGRSPESKDLRTDFTAAVPIMRRSFDSLRSLRMTNLVACASALHRWSSDVCGRVDAPPLRGVQTVFLQISQGIFKFLLTIPLGQSVKSGYKTNTRREKS